jgi:hypothetical protein
MNHFIKLPDGKIINVAHVRRVEKIELSGAENLTGIWWFEVGSERLSDPDGTVYAYFDSIAQKIEEE